MIGKKIKAFFISHPKVRRWFFITLALFVVFAVVKSCFFKPKPVPPPPRPVQTGQAIQKDVPIYINSFGTLACFYNVNLVSQVTGEIQKKLCISGDFVKKGDLLYMIDPKEYKAGLAKAQAALAQDEIDLKMKADTYERNKQLIEKNLISQQDFENFQTDMAAAQAKVKLDEANVRLAEINLGYCEIRSPIDGVLGDCKMDPGNVVTANDGPTLVNIKMINPMYVYFTVSETDLLRVRKAMADAVLEVDIIVTDDPNSPYEANLEFLDNKVDDTTGTVMLRGIVANPEKKLWAGQFVDIKLILYTQKDAVLVPYEAVKIGNKGHYLFVMTPQSTVDMRSVKVGQREGDDIIITEGVQPGETVVTVGQYGLSQGVQVMDLDQKNKTATQGSK